MDAARRGAVGAGLCTFAVFLTPALLAPGPVRLINFAGVVFAAWCAFVVWRQYGRDDIGATFPYRVRAVAPAIVGAAALLFAVVVIGGWRGASIGAAEVDRALASFWSFPFSPVAMYAAEARGLTTPSDFAIGLVAMAFSAALVVGLAFAAIALFSGVEGEETLRRHALIWRGVKYQDGASLLAERGARGLEPLSDPGPGLLSKPVVGRLRLRAVSLFVAIVMLAYAPVFCRIASATRVPYFEGFFDNPLFRNEFFAIWMCGLWALSIAAAIILFTAYLRLASVLSRR